jgi:hypothetical protein
MFGADARAGDPDFCEPIISIGFSSFLSSWKEMVWEDQTPLTATRTCTRHGRGRACALTLHVYTHTTALIQARSCCRSRNMRNCVAPYLGLRA